VVSRVSVSSNTALKTAGGGIFRSTRQRQRSPGSVESLIVHQDDGDGVVRLNARIQAFLDKKLPDLDEHVNAHVAARTEALRQEVDVELSEKFLRQTSGRKVFGGRENRLRWQSVRHQTLQQQLDRHMKGWILEAIQSWVPKKGGAQEAAAQALPEGKETDRIYDYITKRAAQFDNLTLPTEIDRIRTISPSYSLPSMWRDKYPQ
jgi:hypothetical protein